MKINAWDNTQQSVCILFQNVSRIGTLPVFDIIAIWVDIQKHSTEVRVWVVNALNNFNNISCGMYFICSKNPSIW